MRLPELSVRKPVAALMFFAAVLKLGVVSFSRLPVDLMPEIEVPTITVVTVCPGASTEDVESKVTRIVENSLASVNLLDALQELRAARADGRPAFRPSCRPSNAC